MLFKKKKKKTVWLFFFHSLHVVCELYSFIIIFIFFSRVEVVVWHGHLVAVVVSTEKFRHYYIFQYPFAINIFHNYYAIYIIY